MPVWSGETPHVFDNQVCPLMTPVTDNTAGNIVLTAAQVLSGVLVRGGAANRTDTAPTAASVVNAIRSAKVGTSFILFCVNTAGANTWTMSGGTGNTFTGSTTAVAAATSTVYVANLTNITSGSEAVTYFRASP